jgi:transposase
MTNSSKKQKQYTAAEKTKVALEAIRGELSLSQISSKYGVHTTQISNWKKQALELMQQGFAGNVKTKSTENNESELVDKLYKQIGKLSTECEWLKKKSELFKP